MQFSDFIDKAANKLQCLAVFNALFIYSLSLEPNLAGKALVVCFMSLSLMLFYNVIRDAINNYNSGSLAYFSFIGFMTVAGLALSLYAVVKYPAFLHVVLFLLILMAVAMLLFEISGLLETTRLGRKLIVFSTHSRGNDFLVVVTGILTTYYIEGAIFPTALAWLEQIPLG